MTLLETINKQIFEDENLIDENLSEFFDTRGFILQENISNFVAGAKALIDKLEVASENLVQHEAPPEEITKLDRFATILAGLEYFRKKNIGPAERKSLNDVLDNKNVTNYVKNMAVEKAQDIADEIKTHFFKGRIIRREGLDKMIEDIRRFYLAKKANVGPLLHVAAHQEE